MPFESICAVLALLTVMRTTHSLPVLRRQCGTQLLLPLVCLIIGISSAHSGAATDIGLVALIACSSIFRGYSRSPRSTFIVAHALMIATGALLYHAQILKHAALLEPLAGKRFNLVARVTHVDGPGRFYLNVIKQEDLATGSVIATSWRCMCTLYPKASYHHGDLLTLRAIKVAPCKPFQGFHRYLYRYDVSTALSVERSRVNLLQRPTPTWSLTQQREHLAAAAREQLAPATYSLFATLFLGHSKEKRQSPYKVHFARWGLAHYLARSGLHIVIFVLLWQLVLRLIPLSIIYKRLLMMLACATYLAYSWPTISFIRAIALFFLYQIGYLSKQQPTFLHLLSLVCLITLLHNPLHLFFLDFQLSFALAASLGYVFSMREQKN